MRPWLSDESVEEQKSCQVPHRGKTGNKHAPATSRDKAEYIIAINVVDFDILLLGPTICSRQVSECLDKYKRK